MRRYYTKDEIGETKYLNEHATFGEMLHFFYCELLSDDWAKRNRAGEAVDEFLDSTTPEFEDDYDEEDGILDWDYTGYLYDASKDSDDYISHGIVMIPLEIIVEDQTEDYEGDVYGNVPSGHGAWAEVPADMDSGWTWRELLEVFLDWDEDDETFTLEDVNNYTAPDYTFVDGRRSVGDARESRSVKGVQQERRKDNEYRLRLVTEADDAANHFTMELRGPSNDCVYEYFLWSDAYKPRKIIEHMTGILRDNGFAIKRRGGVNCLSVFGSEYDVKRFVEHLLYAAYDQAIQDFQKDCGKDDVREGEEATAKANHMHVKAGYPINVVHVPTPDYAEGFGVLL